MQRIKHTHTERERERDEEETHRVIIQVPSTNQK